MIDNITINSTVERTQFDGLVLLKVYNPPLNTLTRKVRQDLMLALAEIERDETVKTVAIFCDGKTFFSGGDISEFDGAPPEPHLPDLVNRIEALNQTTIAAIHGNCFGGGFEIALACDYRIALQDTKFAFPEVNLGLIPGAGGTQRLPRLIGMRKAAQILTTGLAQSANDTFDMGAIDQIIESPLEHNIPTFIQSLTELKKRRVSQLKVISEDIDDLCSKFQNGFEAPIHNIKACAWSSQLPFHGGQARERKLHLDLRQSAQSKALRHVFFSERKAMRPEHLKGIKAHPLQKIGVVGGGLMGVGICASALIAGKNVVLIEQNETSANAAKTKLLSILEATQKRGKLPLHIDAYQQMVSFDTQISKLENVDIVIEAVFEDLDVKCDLFKKIHAVCSSDIILATNTSYLNPEHILPSDSHANSVGLHFFSPAHIMKLIEVVQLESTSIETLASVFQLAVELNKLPILSGICDGFIGNRMLSAYRRQADYLLADGAMPWQIDEAMRDFGMPMGPYEAQDMAGLQISWANRQRLTKIRNPHERYVDIADKICEAGRLGKSVAAGWYDYSDGHKTPSPFVQQVIENHSENAGIIRKKFSTKKIQDLLLAAMINEGHLIVEEGIAQSTAEVDLVKIAGYGFPKWRGGPLYYGSQNRSTITTAMHELINQSPNSWETSVALK